MGFVPRKQGVEVNSAAHDVSFVPEKGGVQIYSEKYDIVVFFSLKQGVNAYSAVHDVSFVPEKVSVEAYCAAHDVNFGLVSNGVLLFTVQRMTSALFRRNEANFWCGKGRINQPAKQELTQ